MAYRIASINDYVEITLTNHSDETVFVFDSYIHPVNVPEDEVYMSDYSHYYDFDADADILSFAPLLPYLGGTCTDNIRIGKALISKGWFAFSFSEVLPYSEYSFIIPRKAFYSDHFIEYVDFHSYSIYDPKGIPFKVSNRHSGRNYCVEIAVYSRVNWLINDEAYYSHVYEYYKQSKDFELVRIPINEALCQ